MRSKNKGILNIMESILVIRKIVVENVEFQMMVKIWKVIFDVRNINFK